MVECSQDLRTADRRAEIVARNGKAHWHRLKWLPLRHVVLRSVYLSFFLLLLLLDRRKYRGSAGDCVTVVIGLIGGV